jgi:ABC-type siderophore export system fused ATPase/permease subunit
VVIWGGLAGALLVCAAVARVTPHLLDATASGSVPVPIAQVLALLLVLGQLVGLAGLCFYGWHALFTTPVCVIVAVRGKRDSR